MKAKEWELKELYSNLTPEKFENLVKNARKYRAENQILRDEIKDLKVQLGGASS